MSYYEKEQDRLLALWQDVENEEYLESSDDDHYEDEEDLQSPIEVEEEESEKSDEDVEQDLGHSTKYYVSKDNTKWLKEVPPQNVKTRSKNLIKKRFPGVKAYAKSSKTPLDCWRLFFNQQMIQNIVTHTNIKIKEKAANYKENNYHVAETTECEIQALIGLLYLSGVFRNNNRNIEDFYKTDGTGIAIFPATMSMKRFMFLLTCLRFDNINNRAERQKCDKLAPIRAIFEMFVENCQASYTPSEYLTLDEKLEAFRGRCSFRQYIPNKPSKYGLKVQALVDAKSFYVLNMEVYVGQQPDGPYKCSNKPHDIVVRLIRPIAGTNRNVTFDNWYTSYEVMKELLVQHKLTSVGTMRKNKRQIPPQMLTVKNR